MQRYFSDLRKENSFLLNSDDIYHIEKVMRMKIGDCIEVVYEQETYLCEIKSIHPFENIIIKKLNENNENKIKITLVQSLVNEQKMDLILQKSTELGINSFYGYKAVNSIIKENDKVDKRIVRWGRIMKEAAEQSKRNIIPSVKGIINISELCSLKADLKIILSVNEKSNNIKKILQSNKNYATMIIVVGPEGGFNPKEEEKLMQNGFVSVSLGGRVLRTETASIAALSMINYEWMV